MSKQKKHQIWCEIGLDNVIINNNNELTDMVVRCLCLHHKRQIYQNVAHRLDINMYLTRNWFQRGTQISAYHLILMMRQYSFIKDIVYEMIEN